MVTSRRTRERQKWRSAAAWQRALQPSHVLQPAAMLVSSGAPPCRIAEHICSEHEAHRLTRAATPRLRAGPVGVRLWHRLRLRLRVLLRLRLRARLRARLRLRLRLRARLRLRVRVRVRVRIRVRVRVSLDVESVGRRRGGGRRYLGRLGLRLAFSFCICSSMGSPHLVGVRDRG